MQMNSFQRFVNLNPFLLIDFYSWCQGKSDPYICRRVIPSRVKMRIRAALVIDNQAISMQMPKPEVQSHTYNQGEMCVCVQPAAGTSELLSRPRFVHFFFFFSTIMVLSRASGMLDKFWHCSLQTASILLSNSCI